MVKGGCNEWMMYDDRSSRLPLKLHWPIDEGLTITVTTPYMFAMEIIDGKSGHICNGI